MPAHRMERVNRELQRVASRWLQDNFETNDLVTITSASVTRDLSQAIIFIQAAKNLTQYVEQLNELAGRIRSEVKKELHWKRIPNFEFKPDLSSVTINRVESILDNL